MATLHTYFRSSAAYRVRIFLALKGLSYQKKFHQSKTITANNQSISPNQPQGLVPAWRMILVAMVSHLPSCYFLRISTHTRPTAQRPCQKAEILSVVQHIACDIHPLNNLRVLNYLKISYTWMQLVLMLGTHIGYSWALMP